MGQVFTSVSGNIVTIRVVIDPLDVVLTGTDRWAVLISSKTDHGLGSTGTPDFPYYVDYVKANGNYTFTKTLITDKYVAELALVGEGTVDYSMFDISTVVPPVTSILKTINISSNATVEIGDSITLPVTCKDQNGSNMPCPSLKWGSGTSNVTVDNNGVVIAISIGTALVNCWDADTGLVVSNICSITIKTPTCRNPKYKCSGITCISDNCDGTGTFTTPNCDNTCTCPNLGSKCDVSGMQCYYNVVDCKWDCQPCDAGFECQMQGGLAKCVAIVPPVTPPGCTNPKYKWVGGICASDDCDGTGTYTDSACAGGGGGGTATGVLASITIDKTVSVDVGKSKTLTAICKDANGNIGTCPDLVWQSDNESIATVSAGIITGVSEGNATILARDSATNQIVSNAGIATTVSVKPSLSLSDWLQTETCLDSTNKKYCAKNWMFGAAGVTALILLTRKKQ